MPKKTSKADSHFDTLFGARQGEQLAGGFKLIPRGNIERGPQPRQSFPTTEIDELAASIAALRERGEGIEGSGILQPLLVSQHAGGYRLIAGERRYRASEQAGIEQLPAIIIEADESGILLAQLVENLQRRDLPPLEEARGLDHLMSEQKLSLREAARLLGKDRGYLENRLRLLKMRSDVQEMVSVRTDTLQHARLIHPIEDEVLRYQLITAVLAGAGEREIRQRIEGGKPEAVQSKDMAQVSVRTDSTASTDSTTSNTALGNTRNGHSEETPGPPSDPIITSLRPAIAFTTEFKRHLQTLRITPEYRQSIQHELERLKGQITAIEKSLDRGQSGN